MARNIYYSIRHPLIGEAILEYDQKSRTTVDLTSRVNAVSIPSDDFLLFRIEPLDYKVRQGEEIPCIAKIMPYKRKLVPFEKSNQFSMVEISKEIAQDIVKLYSK